MREARITMCKHGKILFVVALIYALPGAVSAVQTQPGLRKTIEPGPMIHYLMGGAPLPQKYQSGAAVRAPLSNDAPIPWRTPAAAGGEEVPVEEAEEAETKSPATSTGTSKGPERNPEVRSAGRALEEAGASKDPKAVARAHSALARTLKRAGREREAIKHLHKAIGLYAKQRDALNRSLDQILLGEILLERSKVSAALKRFEEAKKIIPKSQSAKIPKLLENMAICHFRLHRPEQAKALYSKALSILDKTKDQLRVAQNYLALGEIDISGSHFAAAKSNFLKAEKIFRKNGAREALGLCFLKLAYIDRETGKLEEANKKLIAAAKFLKGRPEEAFKGLPLFMKGLEAHDVGNILIATKYLTGALNYYIKTGDRTMEARARLALGELEADRSRLSAALAHAGRSLKDFRILSDYRGESAALEQIGRIYYLKGYVRKAQEYAQEALAIARKIGARNRMATSRTLLARLHSSLGEVDFAWKMLREASEDCRAAGNKKSRAYVNLTLAEFRIYREASENAAQALEQARKDFESIGDKRGLADCSHVLGLLHELRGEGAKAERHLTEAYKAHGQLWDRLGQGRDLTALGVNVKNRGNYEKALEYFDNALDLRKGAGNLRGVAANLANKGNVRRRQGKLTIALENLKKALGIYRQLGDSKGEADMLTNLANVHAARGAYSHAHNQLTKALDAHREIQDFRGMVADLAAMGKLGLARGDLEAANESLADAKRINARIINPRGQVAILVEAALLKRAKNDSAAALGLLDKALKVASSIDDSRAISSIYLKSAGVYRDKGDNQRALELLQKALEMMRRHGDRLGELWALGRMGIIQGATGDYEDALKNLNHAVELRSELGLTSSDGLDLNYHLGAIYEGFKDYEMALRHYQRALARAQISGGQATLGKTYDRIGNIYYRMEEYTKAKDFLQDALRIHSETSATQMRKKELVRLGDVMSKLDLPEEALKWQMKALALTRETQDPHTEARALTRIGTLYQLVGRPRAALQHYREARDIRLQLGDMRGVNENYLQIALVTSILGDFKSAMEDLKKAFEIAQRSEDRSMLWKAYFVMGRALQGKNRPGDALESYRKAITVLEAMEADIIEESDEDNFIFGGKIALFETTLRVLMKLARKDPKGAYDNQALRIVEKLKAAEFENILTRTNVESFSDVPKELIIREKSVKLALKRINARISDELSRVNQDRSLIKKLHQQRRFREKTLTGLKRKFLEEYPYYSELRYPQPVSVSRLQRQAVRPDETVLEYMVTRSRTYIFAMDQRHFYTYSVGYPLKDIEHDVNEIIRPFKTNQSQAGWDPSVAYRLYSRLIKPVEGFLKGKENLVIIPHGPLTKLPFEILVTSGKHASKRFWTVTDRPSHLVEKYAICYFPSASALSHVRLRTNKAEPGWIMAAFGGANYGQGAIEADMNRGAERLLSTFRPISDNSGAHKMRIRDLPDSEKEIAGIVKIVGEPTQTYQGAQATETLFKRADLSRYAYIHLATRGILLPSGGKLWQRPAIVFSLFGDDSSDGFLELGEIFGLKLNSDMVVLSSALSAPNDGEFSGNSLVALARAFIFAGTDSLVAGFWQSPRDTTVSLLSEMYRNLDSGSKAKALREAKLRILGNKLTSHPYFWGGFALMGDWKAPIRTNLNKTLPERLEFKGISTWQRMLSL